MIVESYYPNELPSWSDEKLNANVESAHRAYEELSALLGEADETVYDSRQFWAGLQSEQWRREEACKAPPQG